MNETDRLKSEALNMFARRLAATTNIEEARGIALSQMRTMLDIIYPSPTLPKEQIDAK